MDKETRIKDIEAQLSGMPKGSLTYKNIKGIRQPYLQWSENGKCNSYYIKVSERESVLLELEKKRQLEKELQLLQAYSVELARILSKHPTYAGVPALGTDVFEKIRTKNLIYVDKTKFIKEWWESNRQVTLITRPRRFGKSLMLSTVEYFFALEHADKKGLFDDLYIDKVSYLTDYRNSFPVINISFAAYKSADVEEFKRGLARSLGQVFNRYKSVLPIDKLNEVDRDIYNEYTEALSRGKWDYVIDAIATFSRLCYEMLGRGPIVLIDEYDTPVQEAYLQDKWEEMSGFYRSFTNATFKSNRYYERAILTGVTIVAQESFFSDMNNIRYSTVLSEHFSDSFGFTEDEVFDLMDCHENTIKAKVKEMYDGFTFGETNNIYNPWSILCYIDEKKFKPYWVHTGGTALLSSIILSGDDDIKSDLIDLMNFKTIRRRFVEEITYDSLRFDNDVIWTLLLSSGYLTATNIDYDDCYIVCDLRITNKETWAAYQGMVDGWLRRSNFDRNEFCKYLLRGDLDEMNHYMNRIAMDSISVFDVGNAPSDRAPERFYHGFVLGLLVELKNDYQITSNRESGFGRYDIMMVPKRDGLRAFIIEFKVFDGKKENSLEDTLRNAIAQIEDRQYARQLISQGIPDEMIVRYGFAFRGKEVLIG